MSKDFADYVDSIPNENVRAAAQSVFGIAELAKAFLKDQGLEPTAADVVALAELILTERGPRGAMDIFYEHHARRAAERPVEGSTQSWGDQSDEDFKF